MSAIYQLIGRLVVLFVRTRFRSQLRIATALTVAAGVGVAYVLASKDVEEG